ncbi:MAG TPA: hypothetical protein PLO50_07180 [Nitrospira sp.]|nr:hypothetical protein [Nitrospira sp.]
MADESFSSLGPLPHPSENPDPKRFLQASLVVTSTQRVAWLEEALQLAYASEALKPRRFIGKEYWKAMGRSNP